MDSFEFGTYQIDLKTLQCHFHYRLNHDGKAYVFSEMIELPRHPLRNNVPDELVWHVGLYLHIALGLSYYKLFAPEKIVLPYKLTQDEAAFFDLLYKKGLGEFYYRNNLDLSRAPSFPYDQNLKREPFDLESANRDNILVGLGGGKDSIVALELLKEQGYKPKAFVLETQKPYPAIDGVIRAADVSSLKVKRIIDSQLFDEIPGSYNGHIPISSLYSLTGFLCAVLYDFSYVVVGNEHSSSFGNIEYQGMEINHQWSKSLEYEQAFQNLAKNSLTPDVTYFSLLRPFYEIRIIELFTKYSQYFNQFTSCNRAFSIHNPTKSLWCGECAKCVFVFLMFSAYLTPEEIIKMFGQNLFEKQSLLPLFKDVIGKGSMKPFDCVGTFDEAQAALYRAQKYYAETFMVKELSPLLDTPEKQLQHVFKTNPTSTIPHQFRLLGMKNVLIVGYGKEGKAAEEFLQKQYPNLEIGLADEKSHPENFKKQDGFDIALRSPGVKKEKVSIHYTTGTNLFMCERRRNTIGVTGTKGKSTVTSLIGHILNAAGRKFEVLGNIGNPLISTLSKPFFPDMTYVVELSSYQLDDLDYSPHISVLTSLYDDHLDYHGDQKTYFEAKKKIILNQSTEDLFVYNDSFEVLKEWTKDTRAKSKAYDRSFRYNENGVALKGEHNRDNIFAAVTVCLELGIESEQIRKALATYKPLPHRLEFVGTFKEINFYDDAIAVVPEATIAAIKALENVDTLLLGGTDRGYDFSKLEKVVKEKGIRNLVLFPDTGKRMFKDSRGDFNVLETESMKEAVEFCFKNTRKGRVCLLSTASPSYRLWKDFEEKGNEFQKWIKELGK